MNVSGPTLVGLEGLRQTLRTIDKTLPARVITPSLRAAALEVLPDAVGRAPVGDTGQLRRSVRVVASQKRTGLRAGGARAFYGPFVHWGTKHIPANPFLKRAAEDNTDRVVQVAEREVRVALGRLGLDVDGR